MESLKDNEVQELVLPCLKMFASTLEAVEAGDETRMATMITKTQPAVDYM